MIPRSQQKLVSLPSLLILGVIGAIVVVLLLLMSLQQLAGNAALRVTANVNTDADNEPAIPPNIRFTGTIRSITDGAIMVQSRRGVEYVVRLASGATIVDLRGRPLEPGLLATGQRVRVRGRVVGPVPFQANRIHNYSIAAPTPTPRPTLTPTPLTFGAISTINVYKDGAKLQGSTSGPATVSVQYRAAGSGDHLTTDGAIVRAISQNRFRAVIRGLRPLTTYEIYVVAEPVPLGSGPAVTSRTIPVTTLGATSPPAPPAP